MIIRFMRFLLYRFMRAHIPYYHGDGEQKTRFLAAYALFTAAHSRFLFVTIIVFPVLHDGLLITFCIAHATTLCRDWHLVLPFLVVVWDGGSFSPFPVLLVIPPFYYQFVFAFVFFLACHLSYLPLVLVLPSYHTHWLGFCVHSIPTCFYSYSSLFSSIKLLPPFYTHYMCACMVLLHFGCWLRSDIRTKQNKRGTTVLRSVDCYNTCYRFHHTATYHCSLHSSYAFSSGVITVLTTLLQGQDKTLAGGGRTLDGLNNLVFTCTRCWFGSR